MEWIWVVSKLSVAVMGGRMDCRLWARRVFPAPGGPMRIKIRRDYTAAILQIQIMNNVIDQISLLC
jgi:hypothetical protein